MKKNIIFECSIFWILFQILFQIFLGLKKIHTTMIANYNVMPCHIAFRGWLQLLLRFWTMVPSSLLLLSFTPSSSTPSSKWIWPSSSQVPLCFPLFPPSTEWKLKIGFSDSSVRLGWVLYEVTRPWPSFKTLSMILITVGIITSRLHHMYITNNGRESCVWWLDAWKILR